ncbi:MAG: hypothetical protein ABIY55_12365, partial [Kofleriaceae bacterium]
PAPVASRARTPDDASVRRATTPLAKPSASAVVTPSVVTAPTVVLPSAAPMPAGGTRLRGPRDDRPSRPDPRPPARRVEPTAGVEPATAVTPSPVELGALSLAGPTGVAIRVDGPAPCALHSVPMRCHLALEQAYEFRFRVSGGATFTAALRAGATLRRYQVDPAREAVDCVDGC